MAEKLLPTIQILDFFKFSTLALENLKCGFVIMDLAVTEN